MQTVANGHNYQPSSGQIIKNDGSIINGADILINALDALGGIAVYNEVQHAIHSGQGYAFSSNGTIANNASITLIGRVGAKQVHFDGMNIQLSSGGVLMEFIEAPTISVIGTLETARRRNRAIGSTGDNTMLIYSGSTVTGGTVIDTSKPPLVSGIGQTVQSALAGIDEGWVLKQNTDYAIRLTNQSGASIEYSASFAWHESSVILS